MKIKNKNLYNYIEAIKSRRRESKKNKEEKSEKILIPYSELLMSLVR